MSRIETLILALPTALPSAVTLCAILWLTLVPRPLPDMDMHLWEHTDKLVHALMMAGMVWASSIDIMRRSRTRIVRMRPAVLLWVTAAVMLLGGGIELAQGAMDMGRGADMADFAADCAGALLAALAVRFSPWPSPRR